MKLWNALDTIFKALSPVKILEMYSVMDRSTMFQLYELSLNANGIFKIVICNIF